MSLGLGLKKQDLKQRVLTGIEGQYLTGSVIHIIVFYGCSKLNSCKKVGQGTSRLTIQLGTLFVFKYKI